MRKKTVPAAEAPRQYTPEELARAGRNALGSSDQHLADMAAGRPVGLPQVKPPVANVPGAYCSECGMPQRDPYGNGEWSCVNGHTDAAAVSAAEAEVIRAALLGREPLPTDRPPVVHKEIAESDVPKRNGRVLAKIEQVTAKVEQATAKIEATSAALDQAMVEERAKEQAAEDARSATAWGNANRAAETELDPAFMGIVRTQVVDDPTALYEQLEKALVVGDSRADYGSVMKHLDEAEANARLAHRLWQSGRIEAHRWEADNAVVFAGMHAEATKSLQREKDQGMRSKQITDADVEARLNVMFHDEWRAQERKRYAVKRMVDSLQNLAELWLSRCRTLQVILTKQR